jgi:hypothetical protein
VRATCISIDSTRALVHLRKSSALHTWAQSGWHSCLQNSISHLNKTHASTTNTISYDRIAVATLCYAAPLGSGSSQRRTLCGIPLVLPWTRHMPLKILLLPRHHQRHHHSGKSHHLISWTLTVSCAMQLLAALCAFQQQGAATGAAAAAR